MSEPLLSIVAYLRLNGRYCPFCCSSAHEYIESFDIGTGRVETRHCLSCDEKWYDNYVLASYGRTEKED